ncbi:MAG: hypothetical protein KIT63_19240 [Rhodoferax sp.]|nr:hypothetical protein [Rhodoferax sp.]
MDNYRPVLHRFPVDDESNTREEPMTKWSHNRSIRIWVAAFLTWLAYFSFSCFQVPKTLHDGEHLYDLVPTVAAYWMIGVARATNISPFELGSGFGLVPAGKLFGPPVPRTVAINPVGFLFCAVSPVVIFGLLFLLWSWAFELRSASNADGS